MNNNTNEKEEIYEIKHHLRDFKPEDIFEDKQEPPKEYISSNEKQSALSHDMAKEALTSLKKEEERAQIISNKKKKIEMELLKLNISLDNKHNPKEKKFNFSINKFLHKFLFKNKNAVRNSLLDEANLDKISSFVNRTGKISLLEVQDLLKISKKQAKNYLNILEQTNKLTKYSRGKLAFYK